MALWVTATNQGIKPGNISDYLIKIGINKQIIWTGHIEDHKRDEQGAALLRKIADTWEREEK